MANDLPPVPIQEQISDGYGTVSRVWSDWFRKLVGSSDRSASGYLKLPGGIIAQWGVTGSLNSATTTAVTFPIEFPTECLQVFSSVRNNSASSVAATGHHGTGNYADAGFDLYNRASIALTFNWLAIGH